MPIDVKAVRAVAIDAGAAAVRAVEAGLQNAELSGEALVIDHEDARAALAAVINLAKIGHSALGAAHSADTSPTKEKAPGGENPGAG